MFRLLVILFVIELHARSDIFINRIFLKLARFKNKNLNRKLECFKGVLPDVCKKKGNMISNEIKFKVLVIFEPDEFSRIKD